MLKLEKPFGENWPAVVQKRKEIELALSQLETEKAQAVDSARQEARLEVQTAESQYLMLSDSYNRQQELVNRLNEASIQYNILRRDVETNEGLYEGLLERLKQTSVTAGLEFGNVHIVEPGRENPVAYSPKVLWNLSLALLFGLGIGVCIAFIAEAWDTSISSIEEVEQLLDLPSLGAVPVVAEVERGKSERKLLRGRSRTPSESIVPMVQKAVSKNGDGTLALDARESFRGICASLLLSCSDEVPRSILITSAIPGEGKTSMVAQLGRTLAENGSRTILLELDLRKPMLAEGFGIDRQHGLSLYLSGHLNPLPKIHRTEIPNLHLISAGPAAPNPLALIHSERLRVLFRELANAYRFILVDSPPLLTVADARVLGTRVDGSVLVVRAGRTPRKLVKRAHLSLQYSGANILGMILNGANLTRADSYYYRYYQDESYFNSAREEPES